MNIHDLHNTKRKLAIIFAIIVFCIALLLELIFFSVRYINISWEEKKQFDELTTQIDLQIQANPTFLTLFIRDGINFKPQKDDNFRKGGFGPEKGIRFLNFLLLDKNGNILAQNFNQDIDFSLDIISKLPLSRVKNIQGITFKKIDIQSVDSNFSELVFFKKNLYDFEAYLQDILFFIVINIFFSIFFYFIGLYFVGKNLKPVEQSLSDMNHFIHNSNHELKTPIAVVSSNLQLLQSIKTYDPELVLDSIKEIKRMDELLSALSELSSINSIQEKTLVHLSQLIEEIHHELKNDIAGKKLKISIETIKESQFQAYRPYAYIVFSNLLRNAIKYNHENGEIKIVIDKNSVSISNTGISIDKEDIPFIFDRFFKGDKGRNTDGFGIGLSLVKKICDIYEWNISVVSDERVTFKILFQ